MPPPDSSIGFAPADWVLFLLAGIFLVSSWLWRPTVQNLLGKLADRKYACFSFFFLSPIVLRLLLLPHHGVPVPDIYDEFGHLLLADTLLHGRLANPSHPMHRFFETFFVLQQPTYSSIYPCGQALVLAVGRLLSGIPWTGVLLMSGACCATCYWMLRGWTTPAWSLLGGAFAVIEFGPLCQWTNSYWGGSLAATAGALVFGAIPRLRAEPRSRDAVLLSLGFGLHMLSRQFESIFLLLAILVFLGPPLRRLDRRQFFVPALLTITPFVLLILFQNKAVTGNWIVLPEQLSRYQYGVPASLTIAANAVPHLPLTPQQRLDYQAQANMHGSAPDTPLKFLLRLEYRVRLYRFFFLPPLYLALAAFFFSLRNRDMQRVTLTLAVFSFGTNLFPYLLDHYLAAVTCLYILVSIVGLQQWMRLRIRNQETGREIVFVLVVLCLSGFTGWYLLHLFETPSLYPILQYETWDFINHENAPQRVEVARQLALIKGPLLVFVRYSPRHVYQHEWVWNEAAIDRSRIVWARDLGEQDNQALIHYYPNRQVLLVEPDNETPEITAYR